VVCAGVVTCEGVVAAMLSQICRSSLLSGNHSPLTRRAEDDWRLASEVVHVAAGYCLTTRNRTGDGYDRRPGVGADAGSCRSYTDCACLQDIDTVAGLR